MLADKADKPDDGPKEGKGTQDGALAADELEVEDIDEDAFEGEAEVAFWS